MMDILLHTIALEPARWTPRRVSQSLPDLLPDIAASGFTRLEIFEPHLADSAKRAAVKAGCADLGLEPVMLSSYVDFGPASMTDEAVEPAIAKLSEDIAEFGFRKLRVFPGPKMDPDDAAGISVLAARLRKLADRLPEVEILLETHDGSVADDPRKMVELVGEIGAPNVGLLFQPTEFEAEKSRRQYALQRPLIRHLHLQNRHPDRTFSRMEEGVIPWSEFLGEGVPATVEFVASGICPESAFDLPAVLAEARSARDYIAGLAG